MTYLKQMELRHEVGHNVQVVTTLEEAAENYVIDESYLPVYKEECKRAFTNGAKWQAERMYSEEDLISFAHFYFTEEFNSTIQTSKSTDEILQEWFEQYKKKQHERNLFNRRRKRRD
jgi:hypothetical protein